MLILLESGMSASQDDYAEDMKECRSTLIPWCRMTLMPEDWPSLFYEQLRPRSHQLTRMPLDDLIPNFYSFISHC